ncbi:serine/threonine protein kinase, partial [candidate division KSB1 bacterium]|nr:serine/threonine protein kinase [candidate division KSB1 bacterium]
MIGKTVSHYKVLEKLGEGGMGVVYLAEDTKLYRKVALKFLLSHGTADPEALKRFQREARVIAALNHPNIVTIYEIGEYDGKSFIAMEYVEGQSLRKMIDSHASSESETDLIALDNVLDISIQMCAGLHEAHKAEIVQRDLKSENVILDQSGTVKILDVGLAIL